MNIFTLDFESYWDSEYALKKLSPLEYVMDDRWETISLAMEQDDQEPMVVFGESDVKHLLAQVDWSRHAACGHNMSGFDSYIMAYRYGIKPKLWICTAAMARPLHAKTCGVSLAALVGHYRAELEAMGIRGVKDAAVLHETKGRRLKDFSPEEITRMGLYNGDDTRQCRGLFRILRKHYSPAELWQIDAIIRMRTEPQFQLNIPMLEAAASSERVRKHASLLDLARKLGISLVDLEEGHGEDGDTWDNFDTVTKTEAKVTQEVKAMMASAAKFSELLTSLGVPVPMKKSPSDPAKMIPALSKTDEDFIALQEHENEVVASAARLRLDVKSTLLETRLQKLTTAGRLAGGMLPIPIRYCGADTTGRDSGEEYNPQNFPRIGPVPRATDALRNGLTAPPGHKIIVADQSGIELRVNHFLWQVGSSMDAYRASPDKADLYRSFAAQWLFRIAAQEITKDQRQIGKIAQLGLGFGAGPATFQRIARVMGGIDMPLTGGDINAADVVAIWRDAYSEIVAGWRVCGHALNHIYFGREVQIDPWGLMHTSKHGIHLPSGRIIRYPDLRQEDVGEWDDGRKKTSWCYASGRHKAWLTGPKTDENCVQALARDSVFEAALEFYRATQFRPALRVHDELIYVVPESVAEQALATLQGILRTPPTWWPELIVWSEGDIGDTYGAAK